MKNYNLKISRINNPAQSYYQLKKIIIIFLLLILPLNCTLPAKKLSDKKFIETIAKKTFLYFWNTANSNNGLIPDATGNPNCSNAVVGFGLAAICIAHQNGWITYKEAYDRALQTLRNFAQYSNNPSKIQVEHEHGHHYHWVNIKTGKWIRTEGIFASDTSAFIAGVLTVGQYFKGTEVEMVANKIYKNVDWTWFLNKDNNFFYIGWTPKGGHGGPYQKTEMGTLPLILAISSPTHPIPVESWFNHGNTYYKATYKKFTYVGDGAAYTHQWPFCFMDPRLKKDYFLDYFQNLREFSLASRQWCIDNKHDGYHKNNWGLNPCVGPDKYGEYAAPIIPGAALPYNGRDNDGTVAPTAAISFMPFTPVESLAYMKYIYKKYNDKIIGEYGFKDSYNVKKDFWCKNYLGIDQGPIVCMLGNYLQETVWKNFMSSEYIKNGFLKIGFFGIIDNFDESRHSPKYAKWHSKKRKYKFFKETEKIKEGKHSLKINFKNIKPRDSFNVQPKLKDFANYKYFAFWKSGDSEFKITLQDKKGKKTNLNLIKQLKDGDWELCYYDISNLKINKKSIKKIFFYLKNVKTKSKGNVYLDYLHLSNNLYEELPPAPTNFKAETGDNRGEIFLLWTTARPDKSQGNIAGYKIKISETPIENKKDFLTAKDAIANFTSYITYKEQKLIVRDLEPGKKYYFAIAVENNIYTLSSIKTSEAIVNSEKEEPLTLDPFELVNFNIADYKTVSSEVDEVQIAKVKGKQGDALKIEYNIKSDAGWHWAGVRKKINGKLPKKSTFIFYFKGNGLNTSLEFKINDKSGNVFGTKITNLIFDDSWHEVKIDSSELTYWWGGDGSKRMGMVDFIELAFCTGKHGKGSVTINKLILKKDEE